MTIPFFPSYRRRLFDLGFKQAGSLRLTNETILPLFRYEHGWGRGSPQTASRYRSPYQYQ